MNADVGSLAPHQRSSPIEQGRKSLAVSMVFFAPRTLN